MPLEFINSGRQNKIVAEQVIDFSDVVSGTPKKLMFLPGGAYSITGKIIPLVAFNSATSDVLDVGTLASGNAYANDANIHITTDVALTGLPKVVDGSGTDGGLWLYGTWVGVSTAPTAGQVVLNVEYCVLGRSQFDTGTNR